MGILIPFSAGGRISYVSREDVDLTYLKPLPYPPIAPSCNCVGYAMQFGIQNEPIDEPMIGGSMRTWEGPIGHRVIILDIREDTEEFVIIESNYVRCQITYRVIPMDSPLIKGFTN